MKKQSNYYTRADGTAGRVQYAGWNDPADVLAQRAGVSIVACDEIIAEHGFAAGAGITRVRYTQSGEDRMGYVIWHAGVDEVVYDWMGHVGTSWRNLYRALRLTYIVRSIRHKIRSDARAALAGV